MTHPPVLPSNSPLASTWALASAAARWSSPWPRSCRMTWVGLDISGAALAVARDNARRHAVLVGSIFSGRTCCGSSPARRLPCWWPTCLMCPGQSGNGCPGRSRRLNPPGPCGGEDGLDLIRPLIRQAHIMSRGEAGCFGSWGSAGRAWGFVEETGAYDTLKSMNEYRHAPGGAG